MGVGRVRKEVRGWGRFYFIRRYLGIVLVFSFSRTLNIVVFIVFRGISFIYMRFFLDTEVFASGG